MPISKARNAERMRVYRAQKKAQGTALLSKALVRRLHRSGINVTRYLTAVPVSLNDYRDMERRLEAKQARIEWQSSGIRGLQDRMATLEALLAMQPAMVDTEVKERLIALEAQQTLHEAEHRVEAKYEQE